MGIRRAAAGAESDADRDDRYENRSGEETSAKSQGEAKVARQALDNKRQASHRALDRMKEGDNDDYDGSSLTVCESSDHEGYQTNDGIPKND